MKCVPLIPVILLNKLQKLFRIHLRSFAIVNFEFVPSGMYQFAALIRAGLCSKHLLAQLQGFEGELLSLLGGTTMHLQFQNVCQR